LGGRKTAGQLLKKEIEFMDPKLAKFSDRQSALMMGALNDGKVGMRNRLMCEASYRLVRADGAAMTLEEDDLIDEIMTCEFRLREAGRVRRRVNSVRKGGHEGLPEPLPVRSRSSKATRPRLVVMNKVVMKKSL
jgi:hypothetical protein